MSKSCDPCRNDPSLAAAEVALLADKAAKNTGSWPASFQTSKLKSCITSWQERPLRCSRKLLSHACLHQNAGQGMICCRAWFQSSACEGCQLAPIRCLYRCMTWELKYVARFQIQGYLACRVPPDSGNDRNLEYSSKRLQRCSPRSQHSTRYLRRGFWQEAAGHRCCFGRGPGDWEKVEDACEGRIGLCTSTHHFCWQGSDGLQGL